MQLTAEQVLALAPDAASAKAGHALSSTAKWMGLGADDDALWGECKGSGQVPYQTRVELATIGYACSCPSRKFPCKHVIGLLLIGASGSVPRALQPEWVTAWLRARRERGEAKQKPARASQAVDEAAAIATAAKRTSAREDNVALGLDELDRWLCDIVRLGIARVQTEPAAFWNAKAARLVDAQAPGMARRVRALGGIAAGGIGWEARMLDALGELYLLRRAYARIDALSPLRRADVRRAVGWAQREDDARARADGAIVDRWTVLGTCREPVENLVAHRAWLRGERTGREALILQFSAGAAEVQQLFAPATAFDATVAYFEATVPQRAVIVERREVAAGAGMASAVTVDEAVDAFARYVAADPWFDQMPACLAVRQTTQVGTQWFACDAAGRSMPLVGQTDPFVLHAVCGGRPIVLVGEWNGYALHPIGAWTSEGYVSLP